MKFLVAQIGARRGYAVPAILEGAGMLERFYTDMTGDVGVTKWLARSGSQFGLNGALGRLASRRLPESIRTRTSTFLAPSLRHTCRLAFSSASPSGRFREHLRWSTDLGHVMIERGFGSATHVFSMLGECGPLLVEAKRRGLAVVSEVYILLSTERIVTAERRSFPDWEPPQPDPNGIRKEFLDEAAFLAHMIMCGLLLAFGLLCHFRIAYSVGWLLIVGCLFLEHWIASRRSLNWINVAFFRLNAVVSSVFLLVTLIEIFFQGGFRIR